jgi:magnesium chelatase family protein
VSRYRKRLSGPLLDRSDLHVEVPRVEYEKLSSDGLAEPSAAVRAGRGGPLAAVGAVRRVAPDQQRGDGGEGGAGLVRAGRGRRGVYCFLSEAIQLTEVR